jgi:hypothetical protein
MRINFDQVFTVLPDGSVEPKQRIRIGGVEMSAGNRFSRGTSFGGVDLASYTENDLEVETKDDLIVIKGIYGK